LLNAFRAATALTVLVSTSAFSETLTIATVNNGDMIRMQGFTEDFTAKTGHEVEWVTLEENVLRQRVTTDISAKGGQFDIMTIGMYETPIWATVLPHRSVRNSLPPLQVNRPPKKRWPRHKP